MAHQQIDHVHRQTQIVIQRRQDLQIGGFQLLAQLFLRLGHQHAEAAVGLQQVGQLVGGIDPVLVRRGGRLLSTLQKAHVLQSGFRRAEPELAPLQPSGQLLRRHGAVQPLEQQVQKRRIAAAAAHQRIHL